MYESKNDFRSYLDVGLTLKHYRTPGARDKKPRKRRGHTPGAYNANGSKARNVAATRHVDKKIKQDLEANLPTSREIHRNNGKPLISNQEAANRERFYREGQVRYQYRWDGGERWGLGKTMHKHFPAEEGKPKNQMDQHRNRNMSTKKDEELSDAYKAERAAREGRNKSAPPKANPKWKRYTSKSTRAKNERYYREGRNR